MGTLLLYTYSHFHFLFHIFSIVCNMFLHFYNSGFVWNKLNGLNTIVYLLHRKSARHSVNRCKYSLLVHYSLLCFQIYLINCQLNFSFLPKITINHICILTKVSRHYLSVVFVHISNSRYQYIYAIQNLVSYHLFI